MMATTKTPTQTNRASATEDSTPTLTTTVCPTPVYDHVNTDNFDVAFCLTGMGHDDPVVVYAHTTVLKSRAHGFWSMMHANGIGTTRPISIHLQDTDPTALRRLLRFVYGGDHPNYDKMSRGEMRDLLVVAELFTCNDKSCTSRCACKEMKLIVERLIISSGFGTDNVCDLLYFAHLKNCSELKSAAVEYLVKNYESVEKTYRYFACIESPGIVDDIIRAAIQYTPDRHKKRPISPNPDEKGQCMDGNKRQRRKKKMPNSSNLDGKGQRQHGKKRPRRKALRRIIQQEIDEVEDLTQKAKLMTDELRSVKEGLDLIKYERSY